MRQMHVRLTSILATALVILAAGLLATGCGPALKQPAIAVDLPEKYNTPDGMVLDARTGDIIVSMPNFNDQQYPPKMLRIDKANKVTEICDLPPHPVTGRTGPLGVDIGPDGNLYVSDNQSMLGHNDHQSRLLRIVMKDGKATGVEVVATGFVMANAVSCHGGCVYVTESNLAPGSKPMLSGVYRFTMDELKADKPVALQPGTLDPHLVMVIKTQNTDWVGANGMGFDAAGNMFVCNFGDAELLKVTLDAKGKAARTVVFAKGQGMKSTDGLKICPTTGAIVIADFLGNAVHAVDAKTGKVTTLAKNGLTDGAGGLLDRPSEVCLRDGKCYVANIDLPLAGNAYDKPHTISVITIKE